MKNFMCFGLFAAMLAGCGSGGAGDPSVEFQRRADAAQAIFDQTSTMNPTPLANMPTDTTTSYSGVASALVELPEGDVEAVYADVSMSANFDNSEVDGNMTNWYGNTIGAIAGTVTLDNGNISGNEWSATGAGTLSADGESGDVSITLDGDFLGPDADALQGTFSGVIFYPGAPDGDIVGSVDALEN